MAAIPNYSLVFNNFIKRCKGNRDGVPSYVLKAIDRHLNDIEKSKKASYPYTFEKKRGVKYCRFFLNLKHFKGEMAGQVFELQPWQVFIIFCIFGWVEKKTGYRRFRYADILVPRKNGKSTFAAGIALAMMVIDGEAGAEIYSAGNDRDQAKVVWEAAKAMVEVSPVLSKMIETYKHAIYYKHWNSVFKPLSKEISNKDGSNPHCAICDERHAWKSNDMFDVLKSGTAARKQSLIFSITTAGRDLSLPYFTQVEVLKKILDGAIEQDNQFTMLYMPDEGDDWTSPATWAKVNPNYGISVSPKYMEQECQEAMNKGGSNETNFKTKNLNFWVNAPEVWISDEKIKECISPIQIEDYYGHECFAGLDIASHVDLNALALFFPKEEIPALFVYFWLPEAKIEDVRRADMVDYSLWYEQGHLIRMEGEVLDIDQMGADIQRITKQFNCKRLSFDPYKAYHGMIQNFQRQGMGDILCEYSQGITNMSEPTKRLESMILGKEILLQDNPVLRWNFSNVVIFSDINSNIKPNKAKSRNKIDGVVAAINAIGGWMANEKESLAKVAYSSHKLRTISI